MFSDAGDRIGAISHNDVVVFDATGKQLHTVTLVGEHPIIQLRGDHTWVATADGIVRHFVGEHLTASIPARLTDIHELVRGGNVIAALGSDTSLAILDANDLDEPLEAGRPRPPAGDLDRRRRGRRPGRLHRRRARARAGQGGKEVRRQHRRAGAHARASRHHRRGSDVRPPRRARDPGQPRQAVGVGSPAAVGDCARAPAR
ncbi:MAG: hypothetical protein WKG01_02170 [Kofleriaceae bacterium]